MQPIAIKVLLNDSIDYTDIMKLYLIYCQPYLYIRLMLSWPIDFNLKTTN